MFYCNTSKKIFASSYTLSQDIWSGIVFKNRNKYCTTCTHSCSSTNIVFMLLRVGYTNEEVSAMLAIFHRSSDNESMSVSELSLEELILISRLYDMQRIFQ